MKLLLIDQDRDLIEMLTGWLKTRGYEVYRAYSAEQARTVWLERRPDLVLADPATEPVKLLSFCQELQRVHDALLLVVSSVRGVADEVACLEAGADDYMRKPFSPSQLLAHIYAVSRRARSTLNHQPPSTVQIGSLRVDHVHRQVQVRGKEKRLTPTECKLLYLLAVNANQVCTANQIVTAVWGYTGDGDSSLIKAHIRHLRQKIEPDPNHPCLLLTVPAVGYTLVDHSGE